MVINVGWVEWCLRDLVISICTLETLCCTAHPEKVYGSPRILEEPILSLDHLPSFFLSDILVPRRYLADESEECGL